jgi:ferredoxin
MILQPCRFTFQIIFSLRCIVYSHIAFFLQKGGVHDDAGDGAVETAETHVEASAAHVDEAEAHVDEAETPETQDDAALEASEAEKAEDEYVEEAEEESEETEEELVDVFHCHGCGRCDVELYEHYDGHGPLCLICRVRVARGDADQDKDEHVPKRRRTE